MLIIVGITGKKQTGKSTLASYSIRTYNAKEMALADSMKESCKILFNWTDAHVYGELKEIIDPNWGISPRQALQWIGTEVFQFNLPKRFPEYSKIVGRKHWCLLLQEKLKKLQREDAQKDKYYTSLVVIPDIRFSHEIESLHKFAFDTGARFWAIKLIRDTGFIDNHLSETESDGIPVDNIIINNGSINDLYFQFETFFSFFLSKIVY